jgi:signal transduction histidine kinase
MKTKRKSIVIYFAVAIFLPCLFLGILAFRGIKNDQALMEREQMRMLHETGQQFIQDTEACLSSVEKSFAGIIDDTEVPSEIIFNDSSLQQFLINHPVVTGIFYQSASGSPMLLNEGFLYFSDDLCKCLGNEGYPIINEILENGWKYEFRERNYHEALEYYQKKLANVTEKQSAGEIWNAIARVQKKLELDHEAIKSYNYIWNNYPQIYLQHNIPLGAAALLESGSLYLKHSDTVSAAENVSMLVELILDSNWKLCYSQYINILERIDDIIIHLINSSNVEIEARLQKIQEVKNRIPDSQSRTEYLLNFLENIQILSNNRKQEKPNIIHRYKFQVNGRSYFTSLFDGIDHGQWGMILNSDYILHQIILPDLRTCENEFKINWTISGTNGQTLVKSESVPENTIPVSISFPSDLPSWSLALYQEGFGLFATLIHPEQSLFLYIFIAIVIILICGLFFTLLTINDEINLSRMKSNFISTVSHEFKSPLTSIRQMAEMLVRGRVSSTEKQEKYHTTILQQSERLSHLIENILDFSKIEEGQKIFRFEKADIIPVVKDIVETFQNFRGDDGFQIGLEITDPLPQIVFDREAIAQVIHNLIDNACKYSGESRIIKVHVFSDTDMLVISIRDQGLGIAKEDQDKIFRRFFRAGEGLSQTVKGSGIGLTIVKQIVDAHHGKVMVESSFGKGSIFTVKLPIRQKHNH